MRDIAGHREEDRLCDTVGRLEFTRSMEIISRNLPERPAKVLDVGGGTGLYAFGLAELGHAVHLVDVVERHVRIARERNRTSAAPLRSIEVGDARNLAHPDGSFDVVLLLRPLYRLVERADRVRALQEARRVLRPDGVALCAFIGRYASLLDGFRSGLPADREFVRIVHSDLAIGRHTASAGGRRHFTDAYLHHPREMRREVVAAGFDVPEIVAVESFAWLLDDLEGIWADVARRELLLDSIRRVEREPDLLGVSSHAIVVARPEKPVVHVARAPA